MKSTCEKKDIRKQRGGSTCLIWVGCTQRYNLSCGPWRVYSREDYYYMYVSVSDTVSLFQGSPVPQLWAVEGLQQGRLLHVCVGV